MPEALENTNCDLACSRGSLAGRRASQGNNKPRYFWVSAASPLGREHLEDGDHGLFVPVVPKPYLGMLLGVHQIIDE